MENINNLSDEQWKELVNKFRGISYDERIRILYDRFDVIRGSETRTIGKKTYVITATPEDQSENYVRWEYYLEKKSQEFYSKWIEVNLKNLDKTPDKKKAIKKHLENLSEMVSKNPEAKKGYDYAITRSGLGWVNNADLSFDCRATLNHWARGLGYYYAETELKKMQDEIEEEKSILDIKTDFTPGYRLVLLEQLGIIDFLQSKYNTLNEPGKIVKVLAEVMGMDASKKNFYDMAYHCIRGNTEKGPSTKRAKDRVDKFIAEVGLVDFGNQETAKKKTRR